MAERTDRDLVDRIAHGDRAALGQLVARHEAMVFRYARSLARTPEAAEDGMQQAFLDVLRGAGSFEGTGTVRSWLLTLTRHAVYRGARKRAGEPARFVELAEVATVAGWGEDPEALVSRAHDQERLRGALSVLRPESHEILRLRDIEGLSGAEAAEVLGLSVAAMKSRLHRARLELAAVLREEGGHGA